MFQNKLVKPLVGILSLLILSSCGAEGLGGGVAEFKTVLVSASATTTSLESDVLTGNTCTASGSTGGTVETDSVDVTITSDIYPGLAASAGLPVAIDGYTVQYIPDNTHSTEPPPALAGLSGSFIGQTVQPGGSLTIPVEVTSQAMKSKLIIDNIIPACSGKIHAYFAIITFNAVELNGAGSTRKNIGPISLNVAFADRIQ
jgi:hypothetical protein